MVTTSIWRRAGRQGLVAVAAMGLALGSLASASSTAAMVRPAQAPVISRLLPPGGSTEQRPRVTILGRHFRHVRSVRFGDRAGGHVHVVSAREIRVTPPRREAGRVRITVVTRAGHSAHTRVAHFTYRELPVGSPLAEVGSQRGTLKLGWSAPRSFDARRVLIRRAAGRVAPSTPQHGTLVARLAAKRTHLLDHGLRRGRRYSYAFFTRSRDGVFSRSTDLTTWIPARSWARRIADPEMGDPATVSCVASGFCAVVDATGHVLTYDGTTWSAPVKVRLAGSKPGVQHVYAIDKVSCSSSSFCVAEAFTDAGIAVSNYNGTAWSSAQPIAGFRSQFLSLSCAPGTTTCVASLMDGSMFRYDGSGWSVMQGPGAADLSCPTAGYCVAVLGSQVSVLSHGTWSAPIPLPGTNFLSAVSCVGEGDCVVLGGFGGSGHIDSFHLQGGTWHSSSLPTGLGFYDVSCVSVTWCMAASAEGASATFDGSTWSGAAWVGPGVPTSVACATATECLLLELPNSVSSWSADEDAVHLWQGSSWTSIRPDPRSGGMTDISCPSPTSCVVVDAHLNAVRFDGTAWSSPVRVDNHVGFEPWAPLTGAVSCPSSGFCAAIFSNGYASTFDGSAWKTSTRVDSNVYNAAKHSTPGEQHIDCASADFCVAIDWTNVLTYNGTSWSAPSTVDLDGLYDVSCPGVGDCLAVDGQGRALSFNGQSWSTPTPDRLGPGPSAVSCPTTSFCVAVGGSRGQSAAWDGTTWARLPRVNHPPSSSSTVRLEDVSCASSTACTAFDSDGFVYEFDGQVWSAAVLPSGHSPNTDHHLHGIDCPTPRWCQAIGSEIAYLGS